ELFLDFAKSLLPFFNRSALCLSIGLLQLHVGGKFLQPRFQPSSLLLELNLLRRKLFEADNVALFLQIESGDFGADPRELLGGAKGIRLSLAQSVLLCP